MRGVHKPLLSLSRHIWVAGLRGEWLEDRDGDCHAQLYGTDDEQLRDDAADGMAIEGEIKGQSAMCWLDSVDVLFNEAWAAFKTTEAHLLERGVKTLAVILSGSTGKPVRHIPLG